MKKINKKINAAIIVIGNEILSGRTEEKNIKFIFNYFLCKIYYLYVRLLFNKLYSKN